MLLFFVGYASSVANKKRERLEITLPLRGSGFRLRCQARRPQQPP